TSVKDTTDQIQDAGDTPGPQHPPAGPPQRTATTLNAPDAVFLACTRPFRQDSRSSRRYERYHIGGHTGSDFARGMGNTPAPPPTGRGPWRPARRADRGPHAESWPPKAAASAMSAIRQNASTRSGVK